VTRPADTRDARLASIGERPRRAKHGCSSRRKPARVIGWGTNFVGSLSLCGNVQYSRFVPRSRRRHGSVSR